MAEPRGPMSSESAGPAPEFSETIRPAYKVLLTAIALAALFLLPAATPSERRVVEGTLEVLTADDFARGRATTLYALVTSRGEVFGLRFARPRPELKTGLRVSVSGRSRGGELAVESLRVLPPRLSAAGVSLSGATSVLVILLKWMDSTSEPYTVPYSQNLVFGATDSVTKYFEENSYGSHTLSGTVTPWFTARVNKPATCDYGLAATEARYAAQQAGYDLSSYQKYVYVFPLLPCGWWGLGGGSQAWINEVFTLQVTAHELGHTFGLGHAGSLDCGAVALGGACTRSEYGHPFSVMGETRTGHLGADQKFLLGYLTGRFVTHSAGTATYNLSPIEVAGGGTYGVLIQTTSNRTYWLEFRQAVGFDSFLSSNANVLNGTLVVLTEPNEYPCSSCLLDMTPATAGFSDGAIVVGQSWTDPVSGVTISVLSKTASALAVQVAMSTPATRTPTLSGPTPTSTRTSTPAPPAATPTPPVGRSLHTLAPCRALDTRRVNGPLGGPALASGADRTFVVTGQCGIPSGARAVSLNVTVTGAESAGDLHLRAGGTAQTLASTINYRAGQTRANNSLIALGAAGDFVVRCTQPSGTVHLIVDVNGYFQ